MPNDEAQPTPEQIEIFERGYQNAREDIERFLEEQEEGNSSSLSEALQED